MFIAAKCVYELHWTLKRVAHVLMSSAVLLATFYCLQCVPGADLSTVTAMSFIYTNKAPRVATRDELKCPHLTDTYLKHVLDGSI